MFRRDLSLKQAPALPRLQSYSMSSDDLNLGIFNQVTNQCLGAFFDLTLSSGSAAVITWVVGGAFLKNVYSWAELTLRLKKQRLFLLTFSRLSTAQRLPIQSWPECRLCRTIA